MARQAFYFCIHFWCLIFHFLLHILLRPFTFFFTSCRSLLCYVIVMLRHSHVMSWSCYVIVMFSSKFYFNFLFIFNLIVHFCFMSEPAPFRITFSMFLIYLHFLHYLQVIYKIFFLFLQLVNKLSFENIFFTPTVKHSNEKC